MSSASNRNSLARAEDIYTYICSQISQLPQGSAMKDETLLVLRVSLGMNLLLLLLPPPSPITLFSYLPIY